MEIKSARATPEIRDEERKLKLKPNKTYRNKRKQEQTAIQIEFFISGAFEYIVK